MREEYQIPEMKIIGISYAGDVITSSNETPFVPFSDEWTGEASSGQ